jgi:hypothetical protein
MIAKIDEKLKIKYFIIVVVLISIFSIIAFFSYLFITDFDISSIDNIPKGDFIKEVDSPNGTYSIKIYLADGNATVDFAIRGELVYKKEKKESHNIYWNYHESSADVVWLDDNTVKINTITLNVLSRLFFYH